MALRKVGLIGLIVLVTALFIRMATVTPPGAQTPTPAPDLEFNAADLPPRLSDLKGKVVLLDFWATWCGPCQMSIPELVKLYNRYKEQGLMIVGISTDDAESARMIPEARKALGMTYPVALASQIPGARQKYQFESIPAFVLIDRKGFVRHAVVGYDPKSNLEGKILELLKEK